MSITYESMIIVFAAMTFVVVLLKFIAEMMEVFFRFAKKPLHCASLHCVDELT